jgi:FkbM family methyltransferase
MFIKKLIKKIIEINVLIFFKALNKIKIGRYILYKLVNKVINEKKSIFIKNSKLSFYIPNETNRFRVNTFFTKEPDTLVWIDSFKEKSVFFDIVANIGLYSCYAAKNKESDTYAFEPSYFNLELLSKNIFVNNLASAVKIVPIPLSSKKRIDEFKMSNTEWGGALSTFGEKKTFDGSNLKLVFKHTTMSITLDECISFFNLPQPDHIKLDVDGIEDLILIGATKTLIKTKSVLIEINENLKVNMEKCEQLLKDSGFKFLRKTTLDYNDDGSFKNCYNYIWLRD